MGLLGKSALIIAGIGYGLTRGLAISSSPAQTSSTRDLTDDSSMADVLDARLERIENALRRLTPEPDPPGLTTDVVTREELANALDRVYSRVESHLEERFVLQDRSIQSLRAMIIRTDEMLEHVLEGIDNAASENPNARVQSTASNS